MTLHRFFVPPEAAVGDRFAVPVSIEHQVRSVLRMRDGDRVVLLPGDGTEVICRLAGGALMVEQRRASVGEPGHRLTVVQALLKGDALEHVVRAATEVGVAAFELVVTDRSIARELSPARLERLRAVAREAAEQSERGIVPSIAPPVPLADALLSGSVLLYERADSGRLSDLDAPTRVIVGPEGGFTGDEVAAAERAGVRVVGLGPRILRSQTAAAAVAASVLSRTGDFA